MEPRHATRHLKHSFGKRLASLEAAGVEHVGEPEGRSHLPDNAADADRGMVEAAGVEPD